MSSDCTDTNVFSSLILNEIKNIANSMTNTGSITNITAIVLDTSLTPENNSTVTRDIPLAMSRSPHIFECFLITYFTPSFVKLRRSKSLVVSTLSLWVTLRILHRGLDLIGNPSLFCRLRVSRIRGLRCAYMKTDCSLTHVLRGCSECNQYVYSCPIRHV